MEFTEKYEKEELRFTEKLEQLEIYNNDQNSIETIYEDLQGFIDRSSDAKILTKIQDISEFMQKSIQNLEHIQKAKGFEKADTEIDPQLKPLSMHV